MIRLYLKNYKPAELVQLYNALSLARSVVKADVPTNQAKDLDEVLQYMSGYMDAKGGVLQNECMFDCFSVGTSGVSVSAGSVFC